MTGTKVHHIEQALLTFENGVGPGAYDQPSSALTGSKLTDSKKKNVPHYSMG